MPQYLCMVALATKPLERAMTGTGQTASLAREQHRQELATQHQQNLRQDGDTAEVRRRTTATA